MIGGVMKETGKMDDLVNNLRIGKKGLMAVSPAIMGLLPMPGGALFSCPILERGGEDVPEDLKVAINIWFRHLLILVYPLSSDLIATTKMVGLNLYSAIGYLFPTLVIALILGWLFFLVKINGRAVYKESFSLKNLLLSLIIILVAPLIDFSVKTFNLLPQKELGTLLGVIFAFILSILLNHSKKVNLKQIFLKMKPYNFSLILIGLFLFLNTFKSTRIAVLISQIPISPLILCIIAGFILALGTGRILLPASVIFPIFLTTSNITPFSFALIYTSIFFGYVVSPVHPCLSVSAEYFKTPLKGVLKLLFPPAMIILLITIILGVII